ncbi:hypothetical protein [Micromonospora sp. DT227]|uniref:hypothetical protein n=1 Tax=Micromonospora sp. DT227 TaxID=3393433 RepID=UPI003CF9D89A
MPRPATSSAPRWPRSPLGHRAERRPDLPQGCPERVDLDLLRYVWRYPRRSRPRVLAAVAAYAPDLPVRRLRGRRHVARFLAGIGKRS